MKWLRPPSPRSGATRRHPLRVTGRLVWFAGIVTVAIFDYFWQIALRHRRATVVSRAMWLQRHSRRALKIFKLEPRTVGPLPAPGLLVSNHQGYLDVLLLAAITPAVFVSRHDVRRWPLVGWLAQMGGTLFVDRGRRVQVGRVNDEILVALNGGALVVLFPEGTSSNGRQVLPFKSALLEPAVQPAHPLTVAAIQYFVEDGDASEEVCYWGDDTFFPHLLNLLGKRAVRATVCFAPFQKTGADRKELARQLHEEILKLRAGSNPPGALPAPAVGCHQAG